MIPDLLSTQAVDLQKIIASRRLLTVSSLTLNNP